MKNNKVSGLHQYGSQMTRINSHNKINKNYNTRNNYQKSIQSKTPYKRPIIDLDHLFKRIYTSTKELLCTHIKKKTTNSETKQLIQNHKMKRKNQH